MHRPLLLAASIVVLFSLAWGAGRVSEHRRTEIDFVSRPVVVGELSRGGLEVGRVSLTRGQSVTFEACSDSGFPDPLFRGALAFDVTVPSERAVVLTSITDADRLATTRRGPEGGCLTIGAAPSLGDSGRFALRVHRLVPDPPEPMRQARVIVRVLAVSRPTDADLGPLALLLSGMVLGLVALARVRAPNELEVLAAEAGAPPAPRTPRSPWVTVALASGSLLFAIVAVGFVPIGGALGGLARGLVLALVQIVLVVTLRPRGSIDEVRVALGFTRPRGGALAFALAPVVGVLLHVAGGWLARLVPATGIAPIETLVSFTSGFVAVALVGVLAPVIEEVFFRGLLYGTAAAARSENSATAVTFVVFALIHVPQTWGAWGSTASVALTGLVLTVLRRVTGSSLVPAVAHLTHNVVVNTLALVLRA